MPSALLTVLRPKVKVVVLAPPESTISSVPLRRIGDQQRVVARAQDQLGDQGLPETQLLVGERIVMLVLVMVTVRSSVTRAQVDDGIALRVPETVRAETGGKVIGIVAGHARQRIQRRGRR